MGEEGGEILKPDAVISTNKVLPSEAKVVIQPFSEKGQPEKPVEQNVVTQYERKGRVVIPDLPTGNNLDEKA